MRERTQEIPRRWWVIILTLILLVLAFYIMIDIVAARQGTPRIIRDALDSTQVTFPADCLTPEQLDILIRVEDPTFFTHHGIDLKTPGAGLTTITQSVGKWFYFDHFKPGIRKLRLMWLARWVIDPLVEKADLLTLFINYGWFGRVNGETVLGLDRAAQVYYGKSIPDLDRAEYISLIGMYPSPADLDPLYHAEANAERVRRIEGYLEGRIQPAGLMDVYYDGSAVLAPRGPK
ncbi:transglycosylase domain-containing protein [bacterium]|nr:transglycosylase domain-containing protein [bacterium]